MTSVLHTANTSEATSGSTTPIHASMNVNMDTTPASSAAAPWCNASALSTLPTPANSSAQAQQQKHMACVVESCRLNNGGIAALASGNAAASLACFRRALKPLIQQLREEAHDETLIDPSATQQQQKLTSMVLPFHIADTERCLATSCPIAASHTRSDSDNNNGVLGQDDPLANLHTRPFGLVETAMSADPVEDSKIRFSIVCFNLALVFHLQGMLENRQTTERLNKARSLYQNIYRLLVERIQQGPTGNAVVDMLFMAVLNNMAQLGQELADPPLSRTTTQRLLVVASRAQITAYGDDRISTWMEQHSRAFLLNVVTDSFAPPMTAAAA